MGIHIRDVIVDDGSDVGCIPGSYLKGRVVIESSKSTQIAGISLRLEGKAKSSFLSSEIKWFKEQKLYNPVTGKKEEIKLGSVFDVDFNSIKVRRHLSDSTTFHAKEKYCDITLQIIGETTLPPNESYHPFCLLLPENLPSSFSGVKGHIKYKVKVKVLKLKKLSSVDSFKKELKVSGPKNMRKYLRTHPRIFEPSVHKISKEFSTFFVSVGKLFLSVTLQRSVFAPSDTVMIRTELDNNSDVNISSLIFKLISSTCWIGKRFNENSVMFKDKVLVEVQREGVGPNKSAVTVQSIDIPQVSTVNIDDCSIIKLYYLIKVEAVADGLHSNLLLIVPIEISSDFNGSTFEAAGFPVLSSSFTLDVHPTQQPPPFGFIQAPSSSSNSVFDPHPVPPNIGFASLPSAPETCGYSDPPPPYPGIPDSIPNYEAAVKYPNELPPHKPF